MQHIPYYSSIWHKGPQEPPRVLFGVRGAKEVQSSPKGPSAISQAGIVEVPVPAMHLVGLYAGYSTPKLRNFGFRKLWVPVKNAVTPAFRKLRVPAEFRCRGNVQPRVQAVITAVCGRHWLSRTQIGPD